MISNCQFHFQQNAQSYAPKRSLREETGRGVKYILDAKDGITAGEMAKEIVKKYEEKCTQVQSLAGKIYEF
ncbi:MAG: hypothetical protein U5N26_08715 [Candidatus Marinimicrobia bacterium]|nr:hypothetical protein [Candidatus Neomarinimicrobiota bacterium]